MPGYELMGTEERQAILDWFDASNGVLFAHGFDKRRNGIFKVREFEREIAKVVGTQHAQVVSSGTAALLVALRALGVKHGDEVITQAFTFVATVEAIIELGATPVITKLDRSLNMDPVHLEQCITPKTKVIVPVHMAGAPADMDAILAIATTHQLPVLEDAAQAFGGSYKGRRLGTLGAAGIYSFDFSKNVTTGEGGAIVTNDRALYERTRALHDHGHEYNPAVPRGRDTRSFAGLNFRMTEIQAVVGLVQLQKLPYILEQQRKNKQAIKTGLAGCGLEFRLLHDTAGDVADTLIFYLPAAQQAARFAQELAKHEIGTKNLPDAVAWHFAATWRHLLPVHACARPADAVSAVIAECACHQNSDECSCAALLQRAIALPINIRMSSGEIEALVAALRRIAGIVLG